ncbi:MAG: hypothetical protein OXH69_21040, partial [Acidobacteria bacterium]|nr:hypothetical protein [Acidobacteriota bacterium]
DAGDSAESLRHRLTGLALSGGGIRSATFALGVLQRLARADLLRRFDYLSTVSGGGYIGGSLTWLLSRTEDPAALGSAFPFGLRRRRLGGRESNLLRHLRLHGNYLTPGKGITALSLAGVVLRGIALNLLVWLPLTVLAFCGLQLLEGLLADLSGRWEQPPALVGFYLDLLRAHGYAALLALVGAAFLVASVLYSVATWRPRLARPYRWRRRFERGVRRLLWAGLVLAGLASLPLVRDGLAGGGLGSLVGGAASVAAGVAGGLGSFAASGAAGRGRVPVGPLAGTASVLVLYGLALVSYDLAARYLEAPSPWGHGLLAGSVALSLLTGWFVNLNYISIHRYYRDRLMEAFLPRPDTDGTTAAAVEADRAELAGMCNENGPYPLVNANLVLVDSDCRRWRKRGGDAFLLSPLYCGSTSTAWVPTARYMQRDPLTLPTAVAISGAAAHPNTGAGGAGPTRGTMLSLLMALLNVRLGYWVPRPEAGAGRRRQPVANHFRAAWHELSPRGFAEHRRLLQISDGGHFENLGVYELVRRRAKLIVCCDAAADPGFDFKDLQVLMRRIGTDFGARIEFDGDDRIERLIPRAPDPALVRARDPGTDAYPVEARFAERGHIRGRVVYPDGGSSTLILVKTTTIPGLDLLTRGYQGANRAFPDQSTADQFFDEEQFEAYRELGWEIADRLVRDRRVDLEGLLRACA